MPTQEEKLDEALKATFPASDAFYLAPDDAAKRKVVEQQKKTSGNPLLPQRHESAQIPVHRRDRS